MPYAPTHEQYVRRILDSVECDNAVSQRSLSRELGIALGLTNLLVRRLIRKGWVRVSHIRANRVGYFLTPAGMAEKTRMSRDYLDSTVNFYRQAKSRVQQQFMVVSAGWPDQSSGIQKRIVFYGAGEVAEIGYVCLLDTDLTLVGVVDSVPRKQFFGRRVSRPEQFRGLTLDGQPFDRLAVMSFTQPDALRRELSSLTVPADRVFWL